MGRTIVEIVSGNGERTAIIASDIIFVQMRRTETYPGTGKGSVASTVVKLRGMEQTISVTGDHYDEVVRAMKKEE